MPYPLDDDAYDGVIYTEVFEHLRDYPVRSLHEITRILRPGGFLFFSSPNAAYLWSRLDLGAARLHAPTGLDRRGAARATCSRVPVRRDRRGHASRGLDVVVRTSRHFHLEGGSAPKRAVKRGLNELAKRRPPWGPQIVMVAQKP